MTDLTESPALNLSTFRPAGAHIRPAEAASLRELGHKWCAACRATKPLEAFGLIPRNTDGLDYRCRVCAKTSTASNRDRHRARWAESDPYTEHRPKTCGSCRRELARGFFSTDPSNPDGLRRICLACARAANGFQRDRHRARWAEADAYADPRPKTCGSCREELPRRSFSTNPSSSDGLAWRCRDCDQGKRSVRRAAHYEAAAVPIDRLALLQETGGRCFYCGTELADGWHLDHVVALVNLGTHEPANAVPACPDCNLSKGGKEWPSVGWDPFSPFAEPAPTYPRGALLVFLPGGEIRRGADVISAAEAEAVEAAPVVPDDDEDQAADAAA